MLTLARQARYIQCSCFETGGTRVQAFLWVDNPVVLSNNLLLTTKSMRYDSKQLPSLWHFLQYSGCVRAKQMRGKCKHCVSSRQKKQATFFAVHCTERPRGAKFNIPRKQELNHHSSTQKLICSPNVLNMSHTTVSRTLQEAPRHWTRRRLLKPQEMNRTTKGTVSYGLSWSTKPESLKSWQLIRRLMLRNSRPWKWNEKFTWKKFCAPCHNCAAERPTFWIIGSIVIATADSKGESMERAHHLALSLPQSPATASRGFCSQSGHQVRRGRGNWPPRTHRQNRKLM